MLCFAQNKKKIVKSYRKSVEIIILKKNIFGLYHINDKSYFHNYFG